MDEADQLLYKLLAYPNMTSKVAIPSYLAHTKEATPPDQAGRFKAHWSSNAVHQTSRLSLHTYLANCTQL